MFNSLFKASILLLIKSETSCTCICILMVPWKNSDILRTMKLDCKMQMLLSIVYWRLPPGEQGGPAGGALGLDVVLLEDDALVGEVVEVRGDDGGVVPGHVVVAQVIRQDEHYVRGSPGPGHGGMSIQGKQRLLPYLGFLCLCLLWWPLCPATWISLNDALRSLSPPLPSTLLNVFCAKVKTKLNDLMRDHRIVLAPIWTFWHFFLSTSWNLKTSFLLKIYDST